MEKLLIRFFKWRIAHISDKQYIYFLSIVVGVLAAISAIIIKKSAHFISYLLNLAITSQGGNYLYFLYPAIGILIAILFMRFVVKSEPGHGIPGVLFAISRKNGLIKRHNTYSSIVASAFTVGFGGSVGLEGPTVSTGAAIGSNIGQILRLNYKQITLMISLSSAAAMAAIFQAPIAGVVFALEVIMIDLTVASIIPLLLATVTAVLTSYFVLGQAVAYPVKEIEAFIPGNTVYYIVLGVLLGLVSVYFTKVYIASEHFFRRFKRWQTRFLIGSLTLGVLIFFFPALYGEGYKSINLSLQGDYSVLFNRSIFYDYREIKWVVFLLFGAVILLKAVATSVTFGSGGVGGIFAPALFIGAFTGLFFAIFVTDMGFGELNPTKFAMVGMGGVIAGILLAPLTGIFLIAEITGGYSFFVPLMIVSTISYATVRIFINHSVYTYQLAQSGDLLTHNKDKNVLSQMKVGRLIETNFHTIKPGTMLADLVKIIAISKRNIFPVVDENKEFMGHILLDDIRNIMFDNDLYNTPIENIMVMPTFTIEPQESMEEVARKFQESGKYNIVVVQNGKYIGYISRANVFSTYRKKLSEISDD
jgi:CIC family chloride channel protein